MGRPAENSSVMDEGDGGRSGLGRRPIPGPIPAGENARYSAEFEALEGEVAKLNSDGPQAVDWRTAVRLATAVLSTQSKDLLAGAYLAYGLYQTESLAGLADGLAILADMVADYWDDLHPPKRREAARATVVNWLAERLEPGLAQITVDEASAPAVLACRDGFDRLLEGLDRSLQTASVAPLAGLRSSLASAVRQAEQATAAAPPPDPAPTPAPAATPAPAPAPAAVNIGSGETSQVVDKLCRDLRQLAGALRAANPADSRAVELMRVAVWLPVTAVPMHDGDTTPLPGPSPERLARCRALAEAGDHAGLFEDIESSLLNLPFWFDGQRRAAAALAARGAAFAAARGALVGALGTLLRRLPALVGLRYADGQPFVDEATRRWLDDEVLGQRAAEVDSPPPAGDPWDRVFAEARQQLADTPARTVLTVFARQRPPASGGRDAFYWDLRLGELCLAAGEARAAMDIAQAIEARLPDQCPEPWEPAIYADLDTLVLRCLRSLPAAAGNPEEQRQRIVSHRARLTWLDIGRALEFSDLK